MQKLMSFVVASAVLVMGNQVQAQVGLSGGVQAAPGNVSGQAAGRASGGANGQIKSQVSGRLDGQGPEANQGITGSEGNATLKANGQVQPGIPTSVNAPGEVQTDGRLNTDVNRSPVPQANTARTGNGNLSPNSTYQEGGQGAVVPGQPSGRHVAGYAGDAAGVHVASNYGMSNSGNYRRSGFRIFPIFRNRTNYAR